MAGGQRKQEFYGWKLVGVLFAVYFLNMGFPYFGGAVINTYMLKQIPMSRSTFGLGFTLVNLFIGLPSLIVAASIVKWGVTRTFAAGSGMILAGTLWLSFFTAKPWQYLLAYGVVVGTGICFSSIIPVTTTVTNWFRKYRGRAMGIPLSASGFAGFLGAPLIDRFLTANGGNWRQAWEVVAAVMLLSGAIAFLFVKERPGDLGQVVDGIPEKEGASAASTALVSLYPWTPGEAVKTASYWMIVIGGIASQFPYFFFIAHGILHMKGAGFSPATAAWVMGLFTMGVIGGKQVGGWLMDKVSARIAFISGLSCYFVCMLVEMHLHSTAVAVLAGILYGLAFGWTFVCTNAATAQFFGPAAFPKLNGLNMLVTGLLSSPAGFVGGTLFDVYGSYNFAFELNMLITAVGIFALAFATMPRPKTALATSGAGALE
jgi:MFS family permease